MFLVCICCFVLCYLRELSPPHLTIFFENLPSKLMLPMEHLAPHTHTLKNEAPPIVCEAPFHEMIPRNSNKQ